MLFVPSMGNDFSVLTSYTAGTRPGTTAAFGTSITPVTTNAYSAFTQVGTDLTTDCYGVYINVNTGFTGAIFRQIAIQLGVDYTGGTTYNTVIDGLVCSQANTYNLGGGMWYYFPIFIPAGSAVGVSARSSVVTAFGVNIRYMSQPPNPTGAKRASFVETLGLTLGAATVTGVSVTPSIAATEPNTWTLIGTTTKRCWWWQFACQHSDTTMTALNYHVDIGVGTSTTVVDSIITDAYIQTSANENFNNIPIMIGAEKMVPGGSNIYARVHNAGTNENAGSFQIVAYGCGG